MYYSCVYATFSYCIGTWGGILLCTHRGDSLIKLQKKIVKTLFSNFSYDDTCLFRKNKILKLQDVYRFRVSVFMYRVMILSEMPTLREDLMLEFPQHSHLTRSSGSLLTPFPRVEVIRMSYKYQFVQVWNAIPGTFKALRSLKLFRKSLMDNMLNTYWVDLVEVSVEIQTFQTVRAGGYLSFSIFNIYVHTDLFMHTFFNDQNVFWNFKSVDTHRIYFLNLVESNRNRIVFTIIRLIWNQMELVRMNIVYWP